MAKKNITLDEAIQNLLKKHLRVDAAFAITYTTAPDWNKIRWSTNLHNIDAKILFETTASNIKGSDNGGSS